LDEVLKSEKQLVQVLEALSSAKCPLRLLRSPPGAFGRGRVHGAQRHGLRGFACSVKHAVLEEHTVQAVADFAANAKSLSAIFLFGTEIVWKDANISQKQAEKTVADAIKARNPRVNVGGYHGPCVWLPRLCVAMTVAGVRHCRVGPDGSHGTDTASRILSYRNRLKGAPACLPPQV
jgi:hypothetical protein